MSDGVSIIKSLVLVCVYGDQCKKDNSESWWLVVEIIGFFMAGFLNCNFNIDENDWRDLGIILIFQTRLIS
jgi:UDP-N-acetylmuramyl pentapeptide phosphotransferase/UDP-N-acetylglucosamine-1-phosphate transferase